MDLSALRDTLEDTLKISVKMGLRPDSAGEPSDQPEGSTKRPGSSGAGRQLATVGDLVQEGSRGGNNTPRPVGVQINITKSIFASQTGGADVNLVPVV